ncbi:MAG: copper homeostasis protein CutC [Gemmatimonadales bacterium]
MTASGAYPLVEVAVDTAEAAEAAWSVGADRLELCQALEVGGLTPSAGLLEAVVAAAKGPVFVMIRLRPGDFVLGPGELDAMMADIVHARRAGAAGVVLGALTPDGGIDRGAMARLVEVAEGLPVTFHRAFDRVSTPDALAALARLGVTRVLTAGGGGTAFDGRVRLEQLRRAGAPVVVAGGGIVADTVVELVESTGVTEVHLSGVRAAVPPEAGLGSNSVPNPARVARVIAALTRAFGRPTT